MADHHDDLVIPETFDGMSDDDLGALHGLAVEAFDEVYGDGKALTADAVEVLSALTEGIERITNERDSRAQAQAARDEAAAELASKVRIDVVAEDDDDTAEAEAEAEDTVTAEEPVEVVAEEAAPEPIAAAARPLTINTGRVRRQKPKPAPEKAATMRDVVFAGDVPGFTAGEGLDWDGVGRALDRRLAGFNSGAYSAASRAGKHLKEQHSVALIRRPMPGEFTVQHDSTEHTADVIKRATSEARLPGGSLVAAGGWCAPSETIYDLCELESRDGMLSLPEIGVARGGIKYTKGPDFATLYNNLGFIYSEANDIAGKYAVGADKVGTGADGSKPCYSVPCPTFDEARLDLVGLCLTAGLLQSRGYPELLARVVRGALVAHDHRINAMLLSKIATASTAVAITAGQAGATAPLLTSLELQAEQYREANRMSRNSTIEAVMPFWVRGAIRADLARRLGVNLLSVGDGQIDAWFRERGVSPQYVYDWQNVAADAAAAKSFPTTVDVLLYAAGTWVKGVADVITIDTLYDSVNLGKNDHTALFTEEGVLVAQVCGDSRKITVPLCADGATHEGVAIACTGVGDKPTVAP